jgi:dolichol-phosphate mannosyltransferase
MKGLLIVVNYDQETEIGEFLSALAGSSTALEIVIVDDASTDRSPAIAEEMGFKVIRHAANRGVGAAIRTGIKYARQFSDIGFVVVMSSNGKMRVSDLPAVIAPIRNGSADYVQGSRFMAGGAVLRISRFRGAAIPVYSKLSSVMLGRTFTDITCGFRAYRLAMFDDPVINLDQEWLNRYEAELYIHYYACRMGLRIVEVPVTIDYSHLEAGRKSKMKPVAGWWSLLRPFFLLSLGIKH